MNFTINLATRVYVDFRKVTLVISAASAVLLFWTFFSIYSLVNNFEQMKRYTIAKPAGAVSAGAKVSDADYAKFIERVKNVNAIIYKRAYDWLQLFDNLEKLVPEGVSLRGLDPSDKGEILKITATGRNFASVRKFVENLEFSNTFTDINLTDQTMVKEGAQVKGMNFTVTCKAINK
jgi:hypothetical protein